MRIAVGSTGSVEGWGAAGRDGEGSMSVKYAHAMFQNGCFVVYAAWTARRDYDPFAVIRSYSAWASSSTVTSPVPAG